MDPLGGGPRVAQPGLSVPPLSASWRPAVPDEYRQPSISPTGVLGTLLQWGLKALADRLTHTRNRKKEERLLDGTPILCGNQNRISPLGRDLNRLVPLRNLIQELIKTRPCLGCVQRRNRT